MNIGVVSNLLKENSINNNKILSNSLEKLSTSLKINKASDDASGLAISDKLRTQASGIKQGIDNANSAIAMMNIADKSMSELSTILDTIKAKSIQMNTDTTSEEGRKIIKTDILKLIESYDDIVCRTNYNQTPLLNGCSSPFTFQVRDNTSDIISIDIDSVEARHLGEPDPYKLKNFITGFNAPVVEIPIVATPPQINFENNNFENGGAGWIATNSVALSGVTNIAGFPMPLDTTYPLKTIGSKDSVPLSMSYSTTFSGGKATLTSNGVSNNGFDVVRGPFLESEKAINISKDATITVKWSAKSGQDAYDVLGYIIDTTSGDSQIIMNETAMSTSGVTAQESTITINKDGEYKFVFVSGTHDLTGGKGMGATLVIDEIEVINMPTIPSEPVPINLCTCDYTDLTRNDDSPTLIIQARNLMKVIDEALSQLNSQRANVGAGTNQLESSARNNLTSYVNLKNAESIIRDVDYSEESANFNKANIISQAGSYVQSQANEIDKQSVSSLLK